MLAAHAHPGARRRPAPLLLGAAVLSSAVVASAALAMRAGLIWIDVSYPLLALWGMVAVLAEARACSGGGSRRDGPQRRGSEPGRSEAAPVTRVPFDVFLSHNSRDKPAVIELGGGAARRGMRVWLDQWELVPGRPWQEAIEGVIETVVSAAVLIGKRRHRPMGGARDACLPGPVRRRRLPVIPVLLPGA